MEHHEGLLDGEAEDVKSVRIIADQVEAPERASRHQRKPDQPLAERRAESHLEDRRAIGGEDQCQRQAGTGPRGEQAKACEQREQHVAHRLVAQGPERRVTVSNTPGRVSEWVISDEESGT